MKLSFRSPKPPHEPFGKDSMNNCSRKLTLIGLIALLTLSLVSLASAQEKGSAKPFGQWSKEDVNKILTDSLWAKTQTLRIQRRGQVRSIAGQTESVDMERTGALGSADAPLDYKFTLRLHSALPLRQALVRKEQLKWNYDKRSAAEQKAFDAQAKQLLLDCAICADNYVVSVGFSSNNSSGNDLVYQWFGASTVPSLKGYIYLANERGERRDLIDFIPPKSPGDDVFFIFPRLDDKGQPLFTATDKKLLFRMSDNNARSITNFSLDISKLIIDGKVGF
jgi:hypothetical protein